jgi:UPF0716 protein FxsA
MLAVLFFGVPLLEIVVLIQVGQAIGPWWTIGLLLLDSIFGAWLIRHQGGRAWRALTDAIASGRMPARELADGMLIVAGGALMLSPGFVTDLFGILMILPFTRPVARRALTRALARRISGPHVTGPGGRPGRGAQGPGDESRPGPGSQGTVVQGEVVDPDEPTQ